MESSLVRWRNSSAETLVGREITFDDLAADDFAAADETILWPRSPEWRMLQDHSRRRTAGIPATFFS